MLRSKAMRQIVLIGLVCFGTVGMFNAISSVGNAGKHNPTNQNLAITSSSIAYIIGFLVAGGLHNMLGPRICVAFGGVTFVLYAGAMLLAGDDEDSLYPPLAGILLGFGAGLIWVTQGAMMMSYPTEDNKGKYIGAFWAIFNLGAVIGSVLPLAMNSRPGMDPDDFSSETYHVYIAIMAAATCLSVFLARPSSIVRDDGEPIIVAKFQGMKAEFVAILSVFCDWRMLLLIPAFFFSNFSYTYQFNDYNGVPFNIRTRSLNSVFFWIAQIVGALVIGYVLDRAPYRRSKRAMLGLGVILLLFMATWIGAYVTQIKNGFERNRLPQKYIDFEHGVHYTGPLAVYAMFGFCDAAFACFCYWLMGALSNKYDDLSRYAGFFKSIQSLGSAVAAPLDLAQPPLMVYLITNWVLCAFSMLAMFLVCRTITDTTIEDDDSASYYGDSIRDGESFDDGARSIAGATEYEGESGATTTTSSSSIDAVSMGTAAGASATGGERPTGGRRRRRSSVSEMSRIGPVGGYDEEAAMGHPKIVRSRRSQESMHNGTGATGSGAAPEMVQVRSTPYIALPATAMLARSPSSSLHPYSQHSTNMPDSVLPYMAQPHLSAAASPSSSASYPHLYIPPTTMGSSNSSSSLPAIDLNGGLGGVGPSAVVGLGGHSGFTGFDSVGVGAGGGVGSSNSQALFLQVPHQPQQTASQRSSVGLLSATTFTSSEEEEMDDFDTRSILTVSSAGHDSIPDMGEMSPFPTSHSSSPPSAMCMPTPVPPPRPPAAEAVGGEGTGGQGTSFSSSFQQQYPSHLFPFLAGSSSVSQASPSSSAAAFSSTTHPSPSPAPAQQNIQNTTIHRPHSPPVSIASLTSSPVSSPGSSPPSSPRLRPAP